MRIVPASSPRSSLGGALLALASALALVLAGCEAPTSESPATAATVAEGVVEPAPVELARDLASLRQATARFHDFAAAQDAGYDTELTPCWYHSELGGMGYHYANMDRLADPTARLLEPEALMYEPGPAGQMRLVGMEYIVPIGAWEESQGEGAPPPSVLGQDFMANETLGLYVLHVWLWRHNPAGLFADWNPMVSCEHAEESDDLG